MALAKDVAEEFEHLAQWLPAIEGIAASVETIYITKSERKGRRSDVERERPIEFDAIPRGMEPSHDPCSLLETHPKELSRAVRTLRKIEAMLATDANRNHAIVLIVAYLCLGSIARTRFDGRGGVGLFVGVVTMPFDQLRKLDRLERKHEANALARGNHLLDEARTVWANLPPLADRPVVGRGRIRLDDIREHLEKPVREAMLRLSPAPSVQEYMASRQKNALRRPMVEGVEYCTPEEVSRTTGLSINTVKGWIKEGRIPAERRENRYFVPASWVRSLEQPVPPANSSELESSQSTESRLR